MTKHTHIQVTLTADMPIQPEVSDRVQRLATAREQLERVRVIPRVMFEYMAEQQCQINHHQTLETMRQRGGLSVTEALAVLARSPWQDIDIAYAHQLLRTMIYFYRKGLLAGGSGDTAG